MIQKVTRDEVVNLLSKRLRFISLGDEEEFDSGEAVVLTELLSYYYLEQDEKTDVQKSFKRFVEKYGLQNRFSDTISPQDFT